MDQLNSLIEMIDIEIDIEILVIIRKEIIPYDIDEQLDLMQIHNLIVLNMRHAYKALKPILPLPAQKHLINPPQLKELQMPAVLTPHRRLNHLIPTKQLLLAPQPIIEVNSLVVHEEGYFGTVTDQTMHLGVLVEVGVVREFGRGCQVEDFLLEEIDDVQAQGVQVVLCQVVLVHVLVALRALYLVH